jgi:hypothetical protein
MGEALRVVPEREFEGVGIEKALPHEILAAVFSRVVTDEGHGHNKGYQALTIVFDRSPKLPPFLRRYLPPEIPRQAPKDVRILTRRGNVPQSLQERRPIPGE